MGKRQTAVAPQAARPRSAIGVRLLERLVSSLNRLASPRRLLDIEQTQDEDERHAGDLSRGGQVVHPQPHVEDPQGQGLDRKELDRAEVGDGFHQNQGQTGDNRGPGNGKPNRSE